VTGLAVRLARPGEIDALVAIDDDACTLDAEAGLVIAFDASHPFVVAERARWAAAIAAGMVEVVETRDGTLAGFAARGTADGEPYLDQLSVRRAWMRRGIGTILLSRAIAWGAAAASSRLWLTTWAHVPWNAPFYARHGFVEHPEAACGPELRAILRRQREVLPDPDRRIAMLHPGAGLMPRGSRARP
jgi:GNAT superfamily N-acetyltransferase